MWTKAGGTGAYNPDAFYRGENGNMLMKEGFIKAPSTPTTTTTGTTPIIGTTSTPTAPTQAQQATDLLNKSTEQLRQEREKAIGNAYSSYNVAKGEYEKNAGYYTNWNDINTKRDNILADVKNSMMQK